MQQKLTESLKAEEDLLADHPLTTVDEAQVDWDQQEGKVNLESILKFARSQGISPD
jgi:hypothetical protein